MTFDGESSADWLDEELRRVPMPDGLVVRLRQLAVAEDDQLDAALRHVPVPKGLLLQLRRIATYDTATIDAGLRDVPLPLGLLSGLATIPAAPPEQLDFELSDVPLPSGFLDRLKWTSLWTSLADPDAVAHGDAPVIASETSVGPTQRRRSAASVSRLAAAAAVVLVLAASYLTAIASVVWHALSPTTGPDQVVVIHSMPELVAQRDDAIDLALGSSSPAPSPNSEEPLSESVRLPSIGAILDRATAPHDNGWLTQLYMPLFVPGLSIEPRDAMDEPRQDDVVLTDVVEDRVLRPHVVADVRPKGLAPAWTDADLLLFLFQRKVNPRVRLAPAMGRGGFDALLKCPVPLGDAADSYELTWNLLGGAKLSASDRRKARQKLETQVRPEEFLAAMNYDFPPAAPGSVALRTYAGISPFGDAQNRLLQVGVQAGELRPQSHSPVHLTVLVDTSSRMAVGRCLEKVRPALRALVEKLGPNDRISLVTCSDAAQVLIDEAGPADGDLLRQGVDALSIGRSSSLGEGLRLACSVARDMTLHGNQARRIVLLCNGSPELSSQTVRQVEAVLRGATTTGTTLTVLDLAPAGRDDLLLQQIATTGQGRYVRAGSAQQVEWCLDEALTGRRQRVADDARLVVTFNPRAVVSYRLIGHEASSIVGVAAGPVAVSLHPGEVSTALFELELRGEGEPLVAMAELTWREPGQSDDRHLSQPISRWQFADSMLETPPSVQTAALAAETAELLRRSYFASPNSHSFARVRQVAADVDPLVAEKPSFQRLLLLIQQAAKAGIR